jgi:bacillolysin
MRINFLLTLCLLSVCSLFGQTRMKQNPNQNSNETPHNTVLDVKRAAPQNSGVPLAQNNLFENVLENFKPLNAVKPSIAPDMQVMKDSDGNIVMIKNFFEQKSSQNRTLEQRCKDYLAALNETLALRNAADEFRIKSTETDELGIQHVRLQQVWKNADVYGGEIILHGKNNLFDMMNGRFYPSAEIATTAGLSDREAQDLVEKDLQKQNISTDGLHKKLPFTGVNKANLVIYHKDRNKNAPRLAWHMTLYPNTLQRFEYFVDAKNGETIHSFLHTCDFVGEHNHDATCEENNPPLDGPFTVNDAVDLFNVPRTLNTHAISNIYYLIDSKRTMYSATKSKLPDDPVGAIWTLDAFNTSPEKNTTFNYDHVKSSDNKWSNKTAVSAHYNGGIAYDYFKKTHSRESINGTGGTIISLINISEANGSSMENAFWNGEAMFYGNGGTSFSPLARGLDVAGHEMSHGVIQETAGLEYQGESGAMNESFADIFGAMIDRNDWQIGEDVVKKTAFPSGALRDLSNPNNGGTSINSNGWQPKNVSEQYKGTQDNGGVHINSGITNFAFYKFSTATTKEKGEKVFYQALTKYLVKSSKFIDLRAAVIQSATDFYGAASNDGGGSTTGDSYQKDVNVNPGGDYIANADYVKADKTYVGINVLDFAKNTSVNLTKIILNSRPSITDNGASIVFVGADRLPYEIVYDAVKKTYSAPATLATSKVFRNIVTSKDGNLLALSTYPEDNKITVFDYSKSPTVQKTFTLTNPTYTQGVSTGDVLTSDAMDFDLTGEYIMYDAKNKINGKTGVIEYWDIGFIKVYDNKTKTFGDGKIEKLFNNLPEKTSVGNPQFSKNSPYIMTFDYIDDFEDKVYVETANLQTGKVGDIFANDNDLGYPTFSTKDDKLAFEGEDFIGKIINVINLGADKLTPVANSKKIIKFDAGWPQWFANGTRKINVSAKDNVLEQTKIYPNPVSNDLTIEAAENIANQTIFVIDLLGKNVKSQILTLGQNNLKMDDLANGTYILKVGTSTRKIVKM